MPFEKGQSGNPNGRPKGSLGRHTKLREMIEPHKEHLLNKAIHMALEGNEPMLKLLLSRLLPPLQKDEPISGITITGSSPYEDAIEISQRLSEGAISPAEADRLLNIVIANMRIIEGTIINQKIENIEKLLGVS